jgi:hypothetical protein
MQRWQQAVIKIAGDGAGALPASKNRVTAMAQAGSHQRINNNKMLHNIRMAQMYMMTRQYGAHGGARPRCMRPVSNVVCTWLLHDLANESQRGRACVLPVNATNEFLTSDCECSDCCRLSVPCMYIVNARINGGAGGSPAPVKLARECSVVVNKLPAALYIQIGWRVLCSPEGAGRAGAGVRMVKRSGLAAACLLAIAPSQWPARRCSMAAISPEFASGGEVVLRGSDAARGWVGVRWGGQPMRLGAPQRPIVATH